MFATLALALASTAWAAGGDARMRQLGRVVDRHAGFAHMTRGVNVCTVFALRHAVDERDIPVLGRMAASSNNRHRLAAAYVLTQMGDAGVSELRAHGERLGPVEIEQMLTNRDQLREALTREPSPGCR